MRAAMHRPRATTAAMIACVACVALVALVATMFVEGKHVSEAFRCYQGTFDRTIYSRRDRNHARLHEFLTGCTRDGADGASTEVGGSCAPRHCRTSLCDASHKYPELCKNHGRIKEILASQPTYYDVSSPCASAAVRRRRASSQCPPAVLPTFRSREEEQGSCPAKKLVSAEPADEPVRPHAFDALLKVHDRVRQRTKAGYLLQGGSDAANTNTYLDSMTPGSMDNRDVASSKLNGILNELKLSLIHI